MRLKTDKSNESAIKKNGLSEQGFMTALRIKIVDNTGMNTNDTRVVALE